MFTIAFWQLLIKETFDLIWFGCQRCVVRVASVHGPRGGNLACNAGVRGLALLDGHLYVLQVGRSSTDVAVHDTSLSLKRLPTVIRRLTVPGLRDASDLAGCGRYRCLYVADVGSDSIHRLYGLEATLSFQSWPVGDKPWGLSVTSVCNVLLSEPNSTTRTPATNTTNGQIFATSQHLDMSRCLALALQCGKFVVELLWACPLMVSVAGACPCSGVWLLGRESGYRLLSFIHTTAVYYYHNQQKL